MFNYVVESESDESDSENSDDNLLTELDGSDSEDSDDNLLADDEALFQFLDYFHEYDENNFQNSDDPQDEYHRRLIKRLNCINIEISASSVNSAFEKVLESGYLSVALLLLKHLPSIENDGRAQVLSSCLKKILTSCTSPVNNNDETLVDFENPEDRDLLIEIIEFIKTNNADLNNEVRAVLQKISESGAMTADFAGYFQEFGVDTSNIQANNRNALFVSATDSSRKRGCSDLVPDIDNQEQNDSSKKHKFTR